MSDNSDDSSESCNNDEKIQDLKDTIQKLKNKHKTEINELSDQLEEKADIIEMQECKITRLNRRININDKRSDTSLDSVRSDQLLEDKKEELSSVKEELSYKNELIKEMEVNMNSVKDEKKTVEDKLDSLINAMDIKNNTIEELNKTIQLHINEIMILQRKINENDVLIKQLEDEIQNQKSLHLLKRDLSESSLYESDSSKTDDTQIFLLRSIEQKDKKIFEMKKKISYLKLNNNNNNNRKFSSNLSNVQENVDNKNLKTILSEVNAFTGKNFNSLEDFLPFFKTLFNSSTKGIITENNKEDYVSGDNSLGSDKQLTLNLKIEDLKDVIYDLECKAKSEEKKFKKKLTLKDEEIEELHEELSMAKNNKPKDSKNKARLKELERKCEELENELEIKIEELKVKEKKLKEFLSNKDKKNHNVSKEYEQKLQELRIDIDKKEENFKLVIKEKDAKIAQYMNGIKNMNLKFVESNNLNTGLENKITDLENKLEIEKIDKDRLIDVSNEQKEKIGNMEREITMTNEELDHYRKNKFLNNSFKVATLQRNETKRDCFPNWWNQHMVRKQKSTQIQCPKCDEFFEACKIDEHIKTFCC